MIDAEQALHAADGITQRCAGDVRMALLAGRMFVLQVAHPAVGAGVAQHSAFRADPWSRLRAIERSGRQFLWSGAAAARAEGERLRAAHRDIHGVDGQGRRYHALEPRAYGWVHMVFLDTTLTLAALYGDPLARADQEQLFAEWHQGGHFLGLRDRDLPRDLDDYRARFDAAVADELEYNEVVAALLAECAVPPAPTWAAQAAARRVGRAVATARRVVALAHPRRAAAALPRQAARAPCLDRRRRAPLRSGARAGPRDRAAAARSPAPVGRRPPRPRRRVARGSALAP